MTTPIVVVVVAVSHRAFVVVVVVVVVALVKKAGLLVLLHELEVSPSQVLPLCLLSLQRRCVDRLEKLFFAVIFHKRFSQRRPPSSSSSLLMRMMTSLLLRLRRVHMRVARQPSSETLPFGRLLCSSTECSSIKRSFLLKFFFWVRVFHGVLLGWF